MFGTECQFQPWTKPGFAGSTAGHPQASATSQSRLSAESITEIQDASSMSSATASCSASRVRIPARRRGASAALLRSDSVSVQWAGRRSAGPARCLRGGVAVQGSARSRQAHRFGPSLRTRIPSRPGTDETRCLSIRLGSGCSRRNRSRVPRGRALQER